MSGSLEWHGAVLRCAIATERAGNSLDRDGVVRATKALEEISDGGPDVARAVLLASDGASFCTGGDVKGFRAAPDRQAHVSAMAETFHAFILAIVRAPVPVVAAVPGWAVGAGSPEGVEGVNAFAERRPPRYLPADDPIGGRPL